MHSAGARTCSFSFFPRARGGAERRRRGESEPSCGSGRRLFFLMNSPVATALSGTGSASPRGDRNSTGMGREAVDQNYRAVRNNGYATCWDEMEVGMGAIAVPIRKPGVGVM